MALEGQHGAGVQFGLLGPLVLTDATGRSVRVAGPRLRVLLAALLLHANTPVSADMLAEAVWDGVPPPAAAQTLRSHIVRLRRVLGPEAGRVAARHPGYLIHVEPAELDVAQFEALCRDVDATLRVGEWARAVDTAARALKLWRGTPLADVPSQSLRDRWVPHLEVLRVQALERRVEGELYEGRHELLVPELRELSARHPLHENFHVQLMLALYRCGRQAEALAAYQRARDVLAEELGVEPGPVLRELHQQMLVADPALSVTGPPAKVEPRRAVPRELPSAVPGFTGRSAELQTLAKLLDRPGERAPGTVVLSAIGGTAGVGKTALAVHWAHRAAGRFPDGQLYVNLRGYDPGRPMPAADALAGFLRSLGVAGQDIPAEADERAARYRSLLAGKRMLVVLDNARSADQVRPLLPGTPACTVVVTSRDALAGLVARDGAVRLELDVLPLGDAVALLRTLIGARAHAEPGAVAKLADQCCRLPLALRVAAELAASRPDVSLAELASELGDLRARLDQLDAGGDPDTGVRAVFSWSYRHLDADAARTFRLLGLHPGLDVEPYATAALTGTTVPEARRALDVLERAHLLSPSASGRHGMHDLLRGYAREVTAVADEEDDRDAALTRLFDYYLHTAAAAMNTLFPATRHRRPHIPSPATPVPALADPAGAQDWLDAERATLVAVAGHAAVHRWPGHVARLADVLFHYLHFCGHFVEAIAIFGHALGAARRTGDRAAEANALNQLGNVEAQQGHLRQGADRHRQALTLFREAGDRAGEARVLGNLGIHETQLGHYEQAISFQQEAASINRAIGDRFGEARAVSNLGLALQRQGRYQEAAGYYQQALDQFHYIGDRQGKAIALSSLGIVDLRLGDYQDAAAHLQQSLALFQEIGNKVGEPETLARLGDVYLGLGRYEQATGYFERALAMSRELGNPGREADALNGLGEILLQTGNADKARVHHATALQLASEVDASLELARAHSGLARACHVDGDSAQARYHWHEALTRYDAIGAPEAREIRAQLAVAGDVGDDSHEPTEESTDDRGRRGPQV
jgi:DNA-binding SARP family transcriptional activator/tetratricopeptide (TPR) repeat protein